MSVFFSFFLSSSCFLAMTCTPFVFKIRDFVSPSSSIIIISSSSSREKRLPSTSIAPPSHIE
jgi:hypothetical protein